jgi:exonuclease III
MKIISFNCRVVAGRKKNSLKILMASHQYDILLLQETMGDSGI